jgi:anti-anti-sigma factor
MRFSLTRHEREDGLVTVAPVGQVDLCAVGALGSAIQDATGNGRVDVVIDLARATFLDCAGIGALIIGRNTAVSRGCGYTVVNPPREVRRVLELTGVLKALTEPAERLPAVGRAAGSRRSGRRRDDRRVAAGPAAPSVAGVFASRTDRSR